MRKQARGWVSSALCACGLAAWSAKYLHVVYDGVLVLHDNQHHLGPPSARGALPVKPAVGLIRRPRPSTVWFLQTGAPNEAIFAVTKPPFHFSLLPSANSHASQIDLGTWARDDRGSASVCS